MTEQIKIAYQAHNEMQDQSAKADAGKPRIDLVPTEIVRAIARVREYGCNKYPGSTENWRDVEIWRYRAAAFRHLLRYLEDPRGLDEESGLPHLHHLACNVAFLVDLEEAQQNQKGDPWELIAERAVAENATTTQAHIYNAHEVACILADVMGDDCACNVNDNDEWLPLSCEIPESTCPDVVGVACWEQWLKHRERAKEAREPKAEEIRIWAGEVICTIDCPGK